MPRNGFVCPCINGHFPQNPKYFATVYTLTHPPSLESHETKQDSVALKVNTLLFGHSIVIYKPISFLKEGHGQYQVFFLPSKFQMALVINVQKNYYSGSLGNKGENTFLTEIKQICLIFIKNIRVLTLQTLPTLERIVLSDVPLSCDISRKKK